MKTLRYALALLLMALLYQQTCLAQVDPWERVKLIENGKKVQVKLHSGKTLNGKMEEWSTDGLAVRQGKNKVVPVAKADVEQVAMVSGMSRKRKFAWGAGITGGVYSGLLGGACAASRGCELDIPPGVLVAGIASLSAMVGGIAALFPQHKEVIYRAQQAPGAAPPPNSTVRR